MKQKAIRLPKKFSALYLQPNLITSFYFLPIIDLLQQFEDYGEGITLLKRKILTNNKINKKNGGEFKD